MLLILKMNSMCYINKMKKLILISFIGIILSSCEQPQFYNSPVIVSINYYSASICKYTINHSIFTNGVKFI